MINSGSDELNVDKTILPFVFPPMYRGVKVGGGGKASFAQRKRAELSEKNRPNRCLFDYSADDINIDAMLQTTELTADSTIGLISAEFRKKFMQDIKTVQKARGFNPNKDTASLHELLSEMRKTDQAHLRTIEEE